MRTLVEGGSMQDKKKQNGPRTEPVCLATQSRIVEIEIVCKSPTAQFRWDGGRVAKTADYAVPSEQKRVKAS